MSAKCRGPTGRKLSETSHDQVICARCTSSGRWYRSANAPVYPWVTLRGQATSRSSSISSTNSALRRADRCRDIRHCGQFNESESLTALIRGDARTEKTELRTDWPKPQGRRTKPPATGNKRLAEQTRKILAKHYASKYRCGNRDRCA